MKIAFRSFPASPATCMTVTAGLPASMRIAQAHHALQKHSMATLVEQSVLTLPVITPGSIAVGELTGLAVLGDGSVRGVER